MLSTVIRSPIISPLQAHQWCMGVGGYPANAIYANGEPIPDPAGGGYLTYEV